MLIVGEASARAAQYKQSGDMTAVNFCLPNVMAEKGAFPFLGGK